MAGVCVRLAPQRTSFCSYAPGEPPGRRQWEFPPPAGTRGEVGNGVSDEPSGSPDRRMCVEQAGEGRGVWRRSEKCSHQSKGAGLQLFELKSDLTKNFIPLVEDTRLTFTTSLVCARCIWRGWDAHPGSERGPHSVAPIARRGRVTPLAIWHPQNVNQVT